MEIIQKVDSGQPINRSEFTEISFPEVMRTLYTRRKTVIIVTAVAIALGLVVSLGPRHYTAHGAIWVEPGESNVYRVSPSISNIIAGQGNDIVASEFKVLQSRTLFLRVAKDLNLQNDPLFWKRSPFEKKPQNRSLADPKIAEKTYRLMLHDIKLSHDPKDEIIGISATTQSPDLSAKIVNTLINDYVAYLFEMRYGATKRASGWLVDQLDDLKKKIEQDQVELTELQGRLGVIGFDEKNAAYLYGASLGELTKAADDASIERIIAEAKLRYLRDSNPNLIEGEINLLPRSPTPSSPPQSLLESLRAEEAKASTEYARLMSQYGPNFPEAKQQKAQLDEIKKEVKAEEQRILNQAELSYNAAAANEKMAADMVQHEKSKAFNSHDAMVHFVLLMHDYEADRELYEGLIQHLQEAGITSGLEAGDINVVDLADVPALPDPPGPIVIMLFALLGGVVAGTVIAFWMGTLDQRITGPEQSTALIGLPLLGQVPHFKRNPGDPQSRSMVIAQRSHYSEAMQSVRAALLLAQPGNAPKVILVTSATPNEGKSTSATNLAAAFARHGGRVLLVDCDLRKGTIARRLHVSVKVGLSTVLTGQSPLDVAICKVPDIPHLFALPDGPRPPDPAILIGSDEMRKVVQACRDRFDLVVLDSPPVLGLADSLHLGRCADSVIMVVRENVSNRRAVAKACSLLRLSQVPVVGCILNDMDPRADAYGYGYTYRSYYDGYYAEEANAVHPAEGAVAESER